MLPRSAASLQRAIVARSAVSVQLQRLCQSSHAESTSPQNQNSEGKSRHPCSQQSAHGSGNKDSAYAAEKEASTAAVPPSFSHLLVSLAKLYRWEAEKRGQSSMDLASCTHFFSGACSQILHRSVGAPISLGEILFGMPVSETSRTLYVYGTATAGCSCIPSGCHLFTLAQAVSQMHKAQPLQPGDERQGSPVTDPQV